MALSDPRHRCRLRSEDFFHQRFSFPCFSPRALSGSTILPCCISSLPRCTERSWFLEAFVGKTCDPLRARAGVFMGDSPLYSFPSSTPPATPELLSGTFPLDVVRLESFVAIAIISHLSHRIVPRPSFFPKKTPPVQEFPLPYQEFSALRLNTQPGIGVIRAADPPS